MKRSSVLKAREGLIVDLLKQLVKEIEQQAPRCVLDTERIECIIRAWIPLSAAEAQAEWDAMESRADAAERAPQKPSIGDRLREAMGYSPDIDLISALNGMIEFVQKHKGKTS